MPSYQDYPEERKNRTSILVRAIVHITMGIFYILIPVTILQKPWLLESWNRAMVWAGSLLFILYGVFRLYRGIVLYKEFHQKS
ncbi:MAG TPA: hypothetical protein PLP34_05150 [Chitinophagaceae bacterium]|nr:hypothetical protein [Chitinophagaceae bacterium]HNF71779.1 hypothetical protein [Chitinophagaceae bacterium]